MLLVVSSAHSARMLAAKLAERGCVVQAFDKANPPLVSVQSPLEAPETLPDVVDVIAHGHPVLSVRGLHKKRHKVKVGTIVFGGNDVPVIAGPCSVDQFERLNQLAASVRGAGAALLRAGLTKARTSPYTSEGLGHSHLAEVAKVASGHGLPLVSEVLAVADVPAFAEHVDLLQVGARNMHNTPLLRAVARTGKPVLLKRGFGSTLDEFLFAADAILAEGNENVILCERGIRTFEREVRFSFDLSALALLLERTRLPVVVDPSHAAGRAALVPAIARAAVAAGADGLIIEVHNAPHEALSDGDQAVMPNDFRALTTQLDAILQAVGRRLAPPQPLDANPSRSHLGAAPGAQANAMEP